MVQEDYLKTILSIELEGQQATVTTLANLLSIKPASATEMVKKLFSLSYLKYQKYKGFELTDKGRAVAIRVLRRHRLWESFLFRILHYSWSEIHEEAEKFEHVMSEMMENKIEHILDFIKFDPHGHPIPTAEGVLPQIETQQNLVTLSSLSRGQIAQIKQVNDTQPSFLSYLDKINLHLNNYINVKDVLEFDKSMEIEFNNQTTFLSRQMTENIKVIVKNKN